MPTRYRSKTGTSKVPGYLFEGTQTQISPPGTPAAYKSSYLLDVGYTAGEDGWIQDVTGNYGKFNNVSHSTWELVESPLVKRTDLKGTNFPSGGWNIQYDTVTLSPGVAISWGKNSMSAGMSSIEGLKTLAISRVPRYAKRQLAGAVSLVELGDTFSIVSSGVKRLAARLIKARHMAETARALGITTKGHQSTWDQFSVRLKQDMNRWWNQNRDLITGNASLTKDQCKKLLMGSIGADLWWKFALDPFIRDVKSVQTALRKADTIVASLIEGTRVYGRATDVWDTSQDATFTSSYPGIGALKCKCRYMTRRTVVASAHRKVKASYVARFRDSGGKAAVLADSLGLLINRTDYWEITPYSFMIDWIFDVQSCLESTRGYQVPPDCFDDTEHAISVKQECSQSWAPYWTGLPGWSAVGSSSLKTYTRTKQALTGQPVAYVPPLKLPSFEQWFTGLEILVQHMTFPKGIQTARRG